MRGSARGRALLGLFVAALAWLSWYGFNAVRTPEAAFHLVVHTKRGRISVHRWMTGLERFIEVLRVPRADAPYRAMETSPIDRDDPTVKPALKASPARETLNRAYDGLLLVKVVALVGFLTLAGGFMLTASTSLRPTGNLFVDGTLLALIPWGAALLVYKGVERARRKRFGPEHARPPVTARDAILTMAAAMIGPYLVYAFAPRAVEMHDGVDVVLAVVGVWLCWVPIGDVRKALRAP